jgi:antitoxin CptB
MTESSSDADRIDANRTYWRSRRGMLELDLLLRPFARDCYPGLDDDLKAAYRSLLERDDQEILSWLQGARQPADELASIVRRIEAFHAGPGARRP